MSLLILKGVMTSKYYIERARCIEVTDENELVDHGFVWIRGAVPLLKDGKDPNDLDLTPKTALIREDGKRLIVRPSRHTTMDGDSYFEMPIVKDGSKFYLGEAAVEMLKK